MASQGDMKIGEMKEIKSKIHNLTPNPKLILTNHT